MKKFIVLSLFGLLIMAFGATAYAQVDFKAYGMLNFGFVWDRNFPGYVGNVASYFNAPYVPEAGGAYNRPQSFMSSYANVFFEWNAGKEVKGVFNVETCNYYSGTNTSANGAADHAGAAFDTGLWDTRLPETRLRTAYVQFAVPYIGVPVPMTITGGILPFAVRPSFMFSMTEGAGVKLDATYDPASFTFYYGKMAEGKIAVADDSNWYSVEGRSKMGDYTIGGYVIYNNLATYPIVYNATSYGAASSNYTAKMWWLGGYVDGLIGPVNFNFDVGLDTGKVKPTDIGAFASAEDVKYTGWATELRLSYNYDKWNFRSFLLYASGSDLEKTGRNGFPGESVASGAGASRKVNGWVFPPGDGQFVGFAESMFMGGTWSSLVCIPQGYQAQNWNNNLSRGGWGGTWVAKLSATYPVTPIYKVTLWGLYIGDTTKHGNTYGNAVKSDGTLRDDKTVGWELSLVNDIQIYKNLNWKVGAGMLFPGDAFDQNVPGTTRNSSPKNPYMFSTVIAYNF